MANAGTAFVQIKGDFGPFRAGLRRAESNYSTQVEGMGKRLSNSLKTAAKVGGAALLAGAAVGAKKSVDAAVDLGEQINKTKVVFRGSEQGILKWSKTTDTALGISSRAALEAAGTFGNMLVPMGFARKEASTMSQKMVDLAADMASFNNADPSETLDSVRAGLAGETEPLRRFGVFLNEARIEAEAMRLGLVKTAKDTDAIKVAQLKAEAAQSRYTEAVKKHGASSREAKAAQAAMITSQNGLEKATKGTTTELTAQQKAAATYSIILKDTKDSQGDFARTSDSLANKQRQLKAQLENIAASLGVALLPALQKGAAALSDFADDVSKILNRKDLTAGEKFEKIGDEIAERLEAALPVIAEAAGKMAPKVAGAFVKGFIQAPALVQIVAGTWLFAKSATLLRGMGLLGAQSGAAFGTGFATSTTATGGAAGGGAAAAGMAGLATQLKGFAGRAGFIGVGLLAADLIMDNLKQRMDVRSKDLNTRLKALTATPELDKLDTLSGPLKVGSALKDTGLFASDEQRKGERLQEILDGIQKRKHAISGETAAEATGLVRNLNLTRQQSQEIQKILDRGRAKAGGADVLQGISAQLTQAKRLTPTLINDISAQLETLPAKARPKAAQMVTALAEELKRTGKIKGSVEQLKSVIRSEVDGVGRISMKGPRQLKENMAAGMAAMAEAAIHPATQMASTVRTYLDAFGAAGIGKLSAAINSAKDPLGGRKHPKTLARGGFLAGMGRKDTIPIMAAPGEAVLNRHQQAPVEAALRTTYGYGLDDLFRKEKRPHFMASGGFAGAQRFSRGGIVALGRRLQKQGYAVGENPAFGGVHGHHSHSYPGNHWEGGSLDVNADNMKGGEAKNLDRLYAQLNAQRQKLGITLLLWRVKDHFDHLHVTIPGGGGTFKGGAVGADAPKIPGVKISGRAGVAKDLAVAATREVRRAAQAFVDKQAATVSTPSESEGPIRVGKPGRGGALSFGQLRRLWTGAGGPGRYSALMAHVAQAESGGVPGKANPDSGAAGLWQIYPAQRGSFNAATNARQAVKKFKDADRVGDALSPWYSSRGTWGKYRTKGLARGGFVDDLQHFDFGGAVQAAKKEKDKDDLKKLDHVFPRHGLGNLKGHKRLTPGEVIAIARAKGFPGRAGERIAKGESMYYPGIVGNDPGGTKGYGLTQVTTKVNGAEFEREVQHLGGWDQMLNPFKNFEAAKWLYDRAGLKPWDRTRFLGKKVSTEQKKQEKRQIAQIGKAKGKDKPAKKPPKLRIPPKGNLKDRLNKFGGSIRDRLHGKPKKGKPKKGKPTPGGAAPGVFQSLSLDAFNKAIDETIPTIGERIDNLSGTFGLTDEEFYPDEKVIPRLKREGHNIQRFGDSFVDWTAVEQQKSELSQLLGQSFQLIGTPWSMPKGVMESVKDSIGPLDASITGAIKRLTDEINEIRRQVRENLREIAKQEKEIDQLDAKMSKEREHKKPNKDKLAKWNREKDNRQDTVNARRKDNRRLTGESAPSGDLSGVDKGTLGERQRRLKDAEDKRDDFKGDKKDFVGLTGEGGNFGSTKLDIQKLVNDRALLTNERITESLLPTTSESNAEIRSFLAALGDLKKQFGSNFKPLKGFAKGGILKHSLALVGEQGFELAKKGAHMGAVGLGGPEIREMPVGTRVYPHEESKRMAQRLGIQPFAQGGVIRPSQAVSQASAPDPELAKALKRIEALLKEQRPVKNIQQDLHFTQAPEQQHAVQKSALFELEAAI